MTDPSYEIRKHYIDLLDISVPVLNYATTQEPPFVIVSVSASGAGTKTSYEWDVITTMDIIVKTDGNWGGDKMADDIANEIMTLLDNKPDYGTTDTFKIVTQQITGSTPLAEITDIGRVIQKTITINNYVSQLNSN